MWGNSPQHYGATQCSVQTGARWQKLHLRAWVFTLGIIAIYASAVHSSQGHFYVKPLDSLMGTALHRTIVFPKPAHQHRMHSVHQIIGAYEPNKMEQYQHADFHRDSHGLWVDGALFVTCLASLAYYCIQRLKPRCPASDVDLCLEPWVAAATSIACRPEPLFILGASPWPGDFESHVQSVALTSDGKLAVTGSSDPRHVRIWDLTVGQALELVREEDEHLSTVMCVEVSPDNRRVVSCGGDKSIRMWDIATGELLQVWTEYPSAVAAVAYSPDASRVASAHWDNYVCIWNTLHWEGSPLPLAPTSPYQRYIKDPYKRPPPPNKNPRGPLLRSLQGHTSRVTSVVFTPDGTKVVSGSWDTLIIVWDVQVMRPYRRLEGHTGRVCGVAVTPDGQRIVSCSEDATVRIWDLETGELLQTLTGHLGPVRSVAISGDGHWIVSGGWDLGVHVWDAHTGEPLHIILGHRHHILSVAVSHDRKRIASVGCDKQLLVWDCDPFLESEQFKMLPAGLETLPEPSLGNSEEGTVAVNLQEPRVNCIAEM